MLGTSIYVNCSRRNPKRSTARAGISCTKEVTINNSSVIRWTFFPEYVIKKGRPHGHRYGEKLEYYTSNQIKTCKKRQFQGVHDRFIRDQEIRIRMIEHHRDEDFCRRCDALADEDHTHHLTAQEYFLYKSKWWLHSKKQGSNTMPLRHRSDFKQALSILQRLQQ